jgi:hypothetical protein
MGALVIALVALASFSYGSAKPAAAHLKPELPPALEKELRAIAANPGASVGYGLKAYLPYYPSAGRFLISYDDPAVTRRLVAEMNGAGRVHKLALLHVLGMRSDPTVDAALLKTLEDPELTATSAYLLGRAGYKGYPDRKRNLAAIRTALRRHLDNKGTFQDPFYHQEFRTQDFVLGAYIRLVGPGRFHFADPDEADLIGLALPDFDAATRAALLEQAKAIG